MSMIKGQFPLVADGEPIVEEGRHMHLYENEDLISNIHGFYQDKDYDDVTRDFAFVNPANPEVAQPNRFQTIDEGRNYAEEARKRARKELKEKRQAHLAKEMAYNQNYHSNHSSKASSYKAPLEKTVPETKVLATKRRASKWSHLTEKLEQDSYILAEIPVQYKESQSTNQAQTPVKKNNYDFLKRSQIYNSQETRLQREKTIAQELNLTRLDDVY